MPPTFWSIGFATLAGAALGVGVSLADVADAPSTAIRSAAARPAATGAIGVRSVPVPSAALDGAAKDDPAALRLFDERILPALKQHCFECHSEKAEELRGNFRADTKEGLRKGGDNGPAVVPGEPERSFLLRTMSYKEDDYKMPPRGKLDDELLADFERWIKAGAPDSRK